MLNFTSFYLLPLLIQKVGGNEADIGFVSSAGWIASVVGTPLSGVLVDRWGRKGLLLAGAALLAAGGLGYLLVHRVGPLMYLLRVLQGVGLAAGLTAGYALVADLAPAARRGEAYGIFTVATLAVHALGPVMGEGFVLAWGFPALFVAAGGYGAVSLLLGLLVRPPASRPERAPSSSLWALLAQRGVWPVLGTMLLMGSSFGAVLTFVPTYIKSRGHQTVSFFFVTYTGVAVLIRVFLSRLSDRLGRRRVILPNLLAMAAVLCVLAWAGSVALFTAAAFLFGTSQGFLHPALGALVVDRVRAGDRGRALGLFSGVFHLGIFLNSVSLGSVAARFGYPAVYWISAGLALGCVAFFARFDPSREQAAPARS